MYVHIQYIYCPLLYCRAALNRETPVCWASTVLIQSQIPAAK